MTQPEIPDYYYWAGLEAWADFNAEMWPEDQEEDWRDTPEDYIDHEPMEAEY